jgi:hypothetical protein
MSTDIDGGDIHEPGDNEAPMFAAAPAWERNRKRRATRAGSSRAANSRTALIAGAAVVLGLGFAGAAVLYATQDRGGVPELAPGTPADAALVNAQAPLPPAPAAGPVQTAANDTPPAPEPVRRASTPASAPAVATRQHTVVRAASAESSGVNASSRTSLPGQPVPYSNLDSASGATASQPGPVNPPAQAAPAIPQTPPVLPQESPPEIQPPAATPPTAA